MKKTIFTIISAILLCSVTFAEKQYRSIIIDGGEISKWMNFVSEDEYDTNGNCTHRKFSSGESFYKYDKSNNLLYAEHIYSEGSYEYLYKYDKNNNRIYEKYQTADGFHECYMEYDSKNRIISNLWELSNGKSFTDITTYDTEGNSCTKRDDYLEIYRKYKNGKEVERRDVVLDENRKQVRLTKYNDQGDEIYYYFLPFYGNEKEYETSYKYNKEGDKIYKKQKGEETFFSYDYEYYDNGKLKKKITYSTN